MGIVAEETPVIVASILASKPLTEIRDACNNNLWETELFQGSGGLTGGTLFNVLTAAFDRAYKRPGEPLIATTIECQEEPQSYIGKLAVNFLNQSLGASAMGTADGVVTGSMWYFHGCDRAESHFLSDALSDTKGAHPAEARRNSDTVVSADSTLIVYGKHNGAASAIIVSEDGLTVNKTLWLPPGTIGELPNMLPRRLKKTPVICDGHRFISFADMYAFTPRRVSVMDIPKGERQETLRTPDGDQTHGFSLNELGIYPDMATFRQRLRQQVLREHRVRKLKEHGLLASQLAVTA